MEERSKHTYRTSLYAFVKDILVVCPHCERKAVVKTGNFQEMKWATDEVKVVCTFCGFNKKIENIPHREDNKQKRGLIMLFGAPVDPFFRFPLWLQADFSGETLWAYNMEHLAFLEQHVGAKLRERNGFKYNVRSIGARLPRWMTSASNREAILKAIAQLKEKQ